MNLLILTTLPHFIPLYYIFNDKLYFTIVLFSGTFSISWHYLCEPKNFVFVIDYLFGLIWSLYELGIVYIYLYEMFYVTILLNLIVLSNNILMDHISRNNLVSYKYAHSIFHITSSLKTIYIAYKVSKHIN